MEYIRNVLKGIVIGIANAIPGVSGGTMMVIMKVFDRIMGAVSLNIKKLKENFLFLLTIFLGMAIGIILSAKVLSICFDRFYVQTQFFFMGVVLGSLPMIYKEATKNKKFTPIHSAPFLVGIAIIIAVTVISMNQSGNSVKTELTASTFVYLVIVSIIAAAAMIMPGLSGSLILLILGGYQTAIHAVDEMNIPILLPIAIGVAIGIIIAAKTITICLAKWQRGTYAVILGLIVGSFYAIWPRETTSTEIVKGVEKTVTEGANFHMNSTGVIAIVFLIIGVILPLSMELIDRKKAVSAEKADKQ
ncbi:MAG: DUF368 domain-containing protein [Ruminococcus sp.]|jgi:putative membrane protein|nr:DUF368 domain-containing protein [Ruminococcus sp.]